MTHTVDILCCNNLVYGRWIGGVRFFIESISYLQDSAAVELFYNQATSLMFKVCDGRNLLLIFCVFLQGGLHHCL